MKQQNLKTLRIFFIFQMVHVTFLFAMFVYFYFTNSFFSGTPEILAAISLIWIALMGYIVKMYKNQKERLFQDRRFSTPVSPDGKELPDNSEELKKMYMPRAEVPKPKHLKIIIVSIINMLIILTGVILFGVYSVNGTEELWIPILFISLLIVVLIVAYIISKKKINHLKLEEQNKRIMQKQERMR